MNSTVPVFLPVGLIDEKLKADKQYWLHKLSGQLAPVSLPADFTRSAHSKTSVFVPLEFSIKTEAKLREICGDNDLLVFTVLVSALKVCLHKYTGQEDIIVGTFPHERYSEAGMLNKVLALRDSIDDTMSVREVMNKVKKTLAEAYQHQKYPFSRLVELLQIERQEARQDLFDVVILLESINNRNYFDSLSLDVGLFFEIKHSALRGTVHYNPSLFSAHTVEVFSRHFINLVNSIIHDPGQTVSQLKISSDEEERGLVEGFNQTQAYYPSETTVHELFERQVKRTPDKPALQYEGVTWTYAQLNGRANQLARYLQTRGIGVGTRVGILMDRSPEMFMSVLGVLKAGGAYVPLEPQTSAAHLAFVLEDSGIQFVLTQLQYVENLPGTIEPLVVDRRVKQATSFAPANLKRSCVPDSVAYIIYTSGSTGRSKGVQITQRSLVNYVWWAVQQYFRDDELAAAFYSSLAFDLTVTSLFCPLISGNTIVIYSGDVDETLGRLAADNIAFIKVTPSHLAIMKERIDLASSLRRIVVGGEAFETSLALEIQSALGPEAELFNEYGPTEATVGCMLYRFQAGRDLREQVPIGIPAANARIYLLDQNQRPVASNSIGEIYIGGDGLALGYLNLPELTAQTFLESPFIPGTRLYRTGDLGRWLPGNQLEYKGRKDDQVKFHGYRVELNEVRTHLNHFPGMKDSAVLIHQDDAGNKVMVAYYAAEQELPVAELRTFMKERMVEALVPSFFVSLPQLPLTENGKINRHALPTLNDIRRTIRKTASEPPRTPTEEVLAGIWCQVMGLPTISVHDDFFGLGGHSLLAVQIVSRARKVMGVGLPLRSLFEAPTVSQLAAAIDQMRRGDGGLQMPPLSPAEGPRSAPLAYAQQRVWFAQQINLESVVYNIYPSFRFRGALDVQCLKKSINAIVARHESLRTNFVLENAGPVQVVTPELNLELPVVDLSRLPEQEREQELGRIVDEEKQRCFDLSRDALIRVKLVRLGEEEHILLLALHHIIADAWSMQILYRELTTFYGAFLKGEVPQLSKLLVQYGDYAWWQRQWLQGEVVEKELGYWREKLRNAPSHIEFSNSRSRPMVTANKGQILDIVVPKDVTDQLRTLSRKENCTMFMTMLAAFKAWIHCYSGADDFVIGIDIANRAPSETEDLIGFFVNLLALRTDLSGNPAFHELIGRVRATCLDAYSHQHLPFEKIVEDLNPERRGDRIPLVQVSFGLLPSAPVRELNLAGLELTPLGGHNSTSVFDFTLYLVEFRDGLAGSIQYSSDLFERATVVRMLASFQQILQLVVKSPEIKLSELYQSVAECERAQRTSSAQDLKKSRLRGLGATPRHELPTQEFIEVASVGSQT